MKLLFAECCGDLVVPYSHKGGIKWCRCGIACCWWEDADTGKFACYSTAGEKAVSILGINNALLTQPFVVSGSGYEYGAISKDVIQKLIADTPDAYLFKKVESLIVKFRPGYTNDSIFTDQFPISPPKS